jgi:excinuclease ABC subunit B
VRGVGADLSSRAGRGEESKIHKPALDEMGIALYHELVPHRVGTNKRGGPRKPTLDEMGPGIESVPAKQEAGSAPGSAAGAGSGATGTQRSSGPRSTLGRAGMRGGFKPRR